MGIALKALNGSLEGQTFQLRAGLTLGRKGDIQINDAKASSLHAKIDQLADGSFAILDNNSKNGLFINGENLPSGALRPDVKILIGQQEFVVVQSPAKPDLPPPPLEAEELQPAPIIPITPPPAPKAKYWYEVLAQFIDHNQNQVVNSRLILTPLKPALILEFQRGPQMHTKWTLGYGPRKVGSACLDLLILEPDSPEICFEVIPTPRGIVFKTAHPEKVLLNGKSVDNETLHVGDNIRINDTLIEVDFIE
jgi:hypothetical protein